jgi:hypothetical protein
MMKLDVIVQAVIISSFGLFGSKAFAKQTALTPKNAERRNQRKL